MGGARGEGARENGDAEGRGAGPRRELGPSRIYKYIK